MHIHRNRIRPCLLAPAVTNDPPLLDQRRGNQTPPPPSRRHPAANSCKFVKIYTIKIDIEHIDKPTPDFWLSPTILHHKGGDLRRQGPPAIHHVEPSSSLEVRPSRVFSNHHGFRDFDGLDSSTFVFPALCFFFTPARVLGDQARP